MNFEDLQDEFPNIILHERQNLIRSYITGLEPEEGAIANKFANSLLQDGALERTVVIIPVAAHQEAAQIVPAMEQYAAQVDAEPFNIVLGLNAPAEVSSDELAESFAAVREAQEKFPQLDIRSVAQFYDRPSIGTIRRDLWNGTLLAARRSGHFKTLEDTIGLNHDIDVVKMSPFYMQRVQQFYAQQQQMDCPPLALHSAGTLMKHAASLDHPNISKTTFWSDFYTRQMGGTYEASMVIPFSLYALRGGFQAGKESYETHELTKHQSAGVIPGTHIQTSPRRYIERVGENGINGIWEDGSFTATDACRTGTFPDISEDQARAIIDEVLASDVIHLAQAARHRVTPAVDGDFADIIRYKQTDAEKLELERQAVANVERSMRKVRVALGFLGLGDLNAVIGDTVTLVEHNRTELLACLAD